MIKVIWIESRNGRAVKCAVLRHGRSWVHAPAQAIGSSLGSELDTTNACGYVWWLQVFGSKLLGCHAIYTLIQCTPLLVEKAGVAPDVTFWITVHKQERVQARDPLQIWNPWGRTHEVQNRGNQWFHKLGLGTTKNFKKKKKKNWESRWLLQSPWRKFKHSGHCQLYSDTVQRILIGVLTWESKELFFICSSIQKNVHYLGNFIWLFWV